MCSRMISILLGLALISCGFEKPEKQQLNGTLTGNPEGGGGAIGDDGKLVKVSEEPIATGDSFALCDSQVDGSSEEYKCSFSGDFDTSILSTDLTFALFVGDLVIPVNIKELDGIKYITFHVDQGFEFSQEDMLIHEVEGELEQTSLPNPDDKEVKKKVLKEAAEAQKVADELQDVADKEIDVIKDMLDELIDEDTLGDDDDGSDGKGADIDDEDKEDKEDDEDKDDKEDKDDALADDDKDDDD